MSDLEDNIKEEEAEHVEMVAAISDIESDAEDTLFVKGGPNASTKAQPTLQLSTSLDTMFWHKCDLDPKFTLLQRVVIKEQAIHDAVMTHLQTLVKELVAVQSKISTHHHVEVINKLAAKYRGAAVLIGLMGATGAGKSSFINALLGIKDLLPADDGAAVTASVIKILWNENDDSEKSLRAVIEFITKNELEAELKALASDLDDEAQDEEDSEPDEERDERIQRTLHWISGIYPFVKSKRDFAKYTILELVDHPTLKNYLGNIKEIEKSVVSDFSTAIKPYISVVDKSDDALWPIVKVVRIYTKSPILKEGICLVDLPGVCDTNTARGAIAEKVQRELHITLVVAESLRAESNKTAQDLLGSVRQRTMKLDNQFATDRLAFVISKSDNQLTIGRYIKNHLTSNPQVMADSKKKEEVDTLKVTADNHLKKKKEEAGRLKTQIATMRKNLANLEPSQSVPLKRKFKEEDQPHNEEVAKLKQEIEDANQRFLEIRSDILTAQEKVDELTIYIDQCKSRMTKACISHRHEQSANAIKEDFARASQNTKIKSNKPLKVFSISANAYFDRLDGMEPLGFDTDADTGIPVVLDWFVKLTLSARKEHSARLLQEIISLEKSLDLSLASSAMGHKMTQEQSGEISKYFKVKQVNLVESLSEDNKAAAEKVDHLVSYYLFKAFPANERTAVKKVKEIVKANGQNIHWSTFRTTNRKKGRYTSVKGKDTTTHDFNANMAGAYFDPLMELWTETIHARVPDSRILYEKNTRAHVENFIVDAISTAEEHCPEISNQLTVWGDTAKEAIESIRDNALTVFNHTIKAWVRDTHPLMDKEIQKLWEAVYESCGDEKGPGHFKRSKKVHLDHISDTPNVATKMFKRGSKAMREHLRILFKSLAHEFETGTTEAVEKMEKDFKALLENHTLCGDEDADKSRFQDEKYNLRLVTSGVFKAIAADWQKPMEFQTLKKEVVDELPFPNLDGLHGSKGD